MPRHMARKHPRHGFSETFNRRGTLDASGGAVLALCSTDWCRYWPVSSVSKNRERRDVVPMHPICQQTLILHFSHLSRSGGTRGSSFFLEKARGRDHGEASGVAQRHSAYVTGDQICAASTEGEAAGDNVDQLPLCHQVDVNLWIASETLRHQRCHMFRAAVAQALIDRTPAGFSCCDRTQSSHREWWAPQASLAPQTFG